VKELGNRKLCWLGTIQQDPHLMREMLAKEESKEDGICALGVISY
jgi:hypothetical protein